MIQGDKKHKPDWQSKLALKRELEVYKRAMHNIAEAIEILFITAGQKMEFTLEETIQNELDYAREELASEKA